MTARPENPTFVDKPKSRRNAQRKDEFIRAALDLFSERGVGVVTIKDIANHVGCNSSLIYYYFESKDDLVKNSIEPCITEFYDYYMEMISDSKDPVTRLLAWLETHILKYEQISKITQITANYRPSTEGDGRVNRYIEWYYSGERKIISDAISAGIKSGVFQKVDADSSAEFIATHLDGIMIRETYLPNFDPIAAIRRLADVMWQMLSYRGERRLEQSQGVPGAARRGGGGKRAQASRKNA